MHWGIDDGVYRERERERVSKRVREDQLGKARRRECMCTFHCSAEQKIITDGAPSSRDFPTAAMDGEGWRRCASENREGGNGMNPGACRVRKKKEHRMRGWKLRVRQQSNGTFRLSVGQPLGWSTKTQCCRSSEDESWRLLWSTDFSSSTTSRWNLNYPVKYIYTKT